ncbi:claudin-11-like isoform X6 [Trichomycterus rosablanca]|uniref:claudin-11-like isoform X6 n=1 Tax=Trichomycterus rosablanca TaxID=2290929 RepID=UPI002F35DDD6
MWRRPRICRHTPDLLSGLWTKCGALYLTYQIWGIMSQSCRLLCGFFLSCLGWIGLIIATSTNDWVITCSFGMHTCIKMDELESKGLWVDCVISTSLYHCSTLNQILTLPAYIQTCRALMVSASLLGLPSVLLALLATPCFKLGDEGDGTKRKRALFAGILSLLMSVCGIVSTVWFPIGAHHEDGLLSFGFSLYAGWVGSVLCLLGGSVMTCCSGADAPALRPENRFYYSKQSGLADSVQPTNSHAKSAHV